MAAIALTQLQYLDEEKQTVQHSPTHNSLGHPIAFWRVI